MYVGTELEDYMGTLRGGVTGVTRTFARKFGKQGLRVTAVQSGLVDLADTSWVSQTVKDVQVPVKSWVTLDEIAHFMAFLAIDSTYTTGQAMIIDGRTDGRNFGRLAQADDECLLDRYGPIVPNLGRVVTG